MSDKAITAPRPLARTGMYAKSPKALALRAQRVRRLVRQMRATMPWLEPSDMPAARGWADLEILSAEVGFWLSELKPINEQGEPRRPVGEFRQLKLAQLAYEPAN
jgi:hypothetical protein